jgi:putative hemolysin
LNVKPHIVDELIEERAPRLAGSAAWPLLKPLLHRLLGYRQAVEMTDAVRDLPGAQALAYTAQRLALRVSARGVENIPRDGALILAANHPTGIADGLALYEAVMPVRPDLIFYANADALRVSPRLSEAVIPVEWLEHKRSREKMRLTLAMTRDALEAGRALAIFPAGRIARLQRGGLTDPPWAATPITLARRHGAPLVPVHVSGPASILFRLFDKVSVELRDITLFHEMLNKTGGRFELIFGEPIAPDDLPGDIEALKAFVERRLPRYSQGHEAAPSR